MEHKTYTDVGVFELKKGEKFFRFANFKNKGGVK